MSPSLHVQRHQDRARQKSNNIGSPHWSAPDRPAEILNYCESVLRRRAKPIPASPNPIRARVAGSGTVPYAKVPIVTEPTRATLVGLPNRLTLSVLEQVPAQLALTPSTHHQFWPLPIVAF